MISQKLPGYLREQCLLGAVCLCSGFSTVSPLGRRLTKVLSFPTEDPGASVQLLHYYRTHSGSVLHSCLMIVLLGLVDDIKK